VYIESAGYFMPGEPIPNERMDAYIAPLNRMSERIKRRILAENGILTRHYAIDEEGVTRHTCGAAVPSCRACRCWPAALRAAMH
jgi:3-oxoacyl-[acyl-carrier-protein] synthase-3